MRIYYLRQVRLMRLKDKILTTSTMWFELSALQGARTVYYWDRFLVKLPSWLASDGFAGARGYPVVVSGLLGFTRDACDVGIQKVIAMLSFNINL